MSIQTKTMVVKSDTSIAETATTIRDTVTFDVSKMPNGITYKGLKAVLSFAEPIQWNKASTYDALTVVWDDASHGSYASKRPVPANIELDNEFYWLRTADLDAQVEMYRQEVREMDGRVTANTTAIAVETARAESAEQTLQTNVDKLSVFVTPEMYGAVGDGVTDDYEALQQCFNANKPVILKKDSTYFTNKGLCIKSDVYGNNSSIVCNDNLTQPSENPQNSVLSIVYILGKNITFKNVNIVKTGGWNDYWNGERNTDNIIGGITISLNAKNIVIDSCYVNTPMHGILCYSADAGNISVINCNVTAGIAYQFEIPDTSTVAITEPKSVNLLNCYGKGNMILAYGQNRGFTVSACCFENFVTSLQPGIFAVINDAKSGYYVNNSVFNGCSFTNNSTQSTNNTIFETQPLNPVSNINGNIGIELNGCSFNNNLTRRNTQPIVRNTSSSISLNNCTFNNGYVENKHERNNCFLSLINCNFNFDAMENYLVTGDDIATIIGCVFTTTDTTSTVAMINISGLIANCTFNNPNRPPILSDGKDVISIGNKTTYEYMTNIGTTKYTYHGLQNISNNKPDKDDGSQLLPPTSLTNASSRLTPKKGDIVFDLDTNSLAFWNGTEWKKLNA